MIRVVQRVINSRPSFKYLKKIVEKVITAAIKKYPRHKPL